MYDYDSMQKQNKKFNEISLAVFGLISLLAIVAIVIAIANREPPPPREPRKPINWEKVGEGLGDRGARFGHGIVKGAKNASKDMKERDKAEKENQDQ